MRRLGLGLGFGFGLGLGLGLVLVQPRLADHGLPRRVARGLGGRRTLDERGPLGGGALPEPVGKRDALLPQPTSDPLARALGIPASGLGRRPSVSWRPLERWRVASEGLGPLPRRKGSALGRGCDTGGRVALRLARAAACQPARGYLCRTKQVLCSLAAWPQLQTHGLSKPLQSHSVHA